MKTTNERQEAFRRRMINAGLVQVNVWATKEAADEIKQIALDSRVKLVADSK